MKPKNLHYFSCHGFSGDIFTPIHFSCNTIDAKLLLTQENHTKISADKQNHL